jgi:hypothetical protein
LPVILSAAKDPSAHPPANIPLDSSPSLPLSVRMTTRGVHWQLREEPNETFDPFANPGRMSEFFPSLNPIDPASPFVLI